MSPIQLVNSNAPAYDRRTIFGKKEGSFDERKIHFK